MLNIQEAGQSPGGWRWRSKEQRRRFPLDTVRPPAVLWPGEPWSIEARFVNVPSPTDDLRFRPILIRDHVTAHYWQLQRLGRYIVWRVAKRPTDTYRRFNLVVDCPCNS